MTVTSSDLNSSLSPCPSPYAMDRLVSQDELFPLRAPFTVLEPCISPFLSVQCDPDGDGEISLAEWGQCLDIPPGEHWKR